MESNVKSGCDERLKKMCKFLNIDQNTIEEIDENTKHEIELMHLDKTLKEYHSYDQTLKYAARKRRINDIIDGKRKQPQNPELQLTVEVEKFYKNFSKWFVDLAYREWENKIKNTGAGKIDIYFNSKEIFISQNEYVFHYEKKFVTQEKVLTILEKDAMINAIKKAVSERIQSNEISVMIVPVERNDLNGVYDLLVSIDVTLI
jgi:hypothetical protein